MHHPATRNAVLAAIGLLAAAVAATALVQVADPAPDPGEREQAGVLAASAANPLLTPSGAVRNITFYYDGTLPLVGTERERLRSHLGSPGIVVTTPRTEDEAATVATIHAIGARAYRYVQYYWAPDTSAYHGIDLREHPEWRFCRRGSTPSVGRETADGATRWFLLDLNERALRTRISEQLAQYAATGWDGVFIDRGEAATQYAADAAGRPVWHRVSTCTEEPAKAGARFADAHVRMLALAHRNGLQAMMNTGKSPFDPIRPMRPDPRKAACRNGRWEKCPTLSDAWRHLDLVVNETAARPRAVDWQRTFVGNRRSERNSAHGRRTVGLITSASLGGRERQTRRNVFYEWSRIKLFDLPVAVNTGDDRCAQAPATAVCNRFGIYPELVDSVLGRPLTKAPGSRQCIGRSEVRCVWLRQYRQGTVVLNVTPRRRDKVRIPLGFKGCRHVYDVWSGVPLARDRCVTSVRLDLTKWSGRPLLLSRRPW